MRFIESPYRVVKNEKVTSEVVYLHQLWKRVDILLRKPMQRLQVPEKI